MKRVRLESIFKNTAFACRKRFQHLTIPTPSRLDDDSDPDEQRFVTIGMGATGRLLVVVYVWRGENIRIIPARTAESHERKEYEGEE